MSEAPAIQYERAPCPTCGKVQEDDAAACQMRRDETGEAWCEGGEPDGEGYIVQPTAASLAALDAWIDANSHAWIVASPTSTEERKV